MFIRLSSMRQNAMKKNLSQQLKIDIGIRISYYSLLEVLFISAKKVSKNIIVRTIVNAAKHKAIYKI